MILIRLFCGSLIGLPLSVLAAAGKVDTPVAGQVFQVIFALLLVLGVIVGAAWAMRRFSLVPGGANSQMRVVSGVMVGTRERVVIVEVRDTWLVLGVTSEQVNLLHSLEKPLDVPETKPNTPQFAEWLQKAMAKRKEMK
ncbi:flagellar biosynthetic protein FliO [Deefgea tanakiae]|uniref:Flagellar protein n=1 Tax=Deefgea tanakiae TaxID=2865840 RepID=A0ABX8Z2T5_9NEIS|nr:flagellar biosynthetic protein FliO [Deefgea tanakiae]QZA76891.1 flagellar biosynthetic protein FliO [Deefgea tanakiae]